MRPQLLKAALGLLAAGFLVGCSSKGGSEVGHYSVRVPQTSMYRYGPAQNFGADFNLTQGQHVVMLGKAYGYSRVMTDDGQSGYVATEDLVPAPPPLVQKPKQSNSGGLFARLPSRGSSRPSAPSAPILQGAPLFGSGEGDLDPLPPLPAGDPLPSAGPTASGSTGGKPGFRVNLPPPSGNSPAPKTERKTDGKTKPGFRVNVPTR